MAGRMKERPYKFGQFGRPHSPENCYIEFRLNSDLHLGTVKTNSIKHERSLQTS